MHRARVKTAIDNFIKRSTRESKDRKNKKPEKEVERQVMKWCKLRQWSVDVVESKAVFSESAGRFLSGQTKSGFADIVGNDPHGVSVAIELKSPGRLRTVRESQYAWLRNKIESNCFAVVVDSADRLENYYREYTALSPSNKKSYLLSILPVPKSLQDDGDQLFSD